MSIRTLQRTELCWMLRKVVRPCKLFAGQLRDRSKSKQPAQLPTGPAKIKRSAAIYKFKHSFLSICAYCTRSFLATAVLMASKDLDNLWSKMTAIGVEGSVWRGWSQSAFAPKHHIFSGDLDVSFLPICGQQGLGERHTWSRQVTRLHFILAMQFLSALFAFWVLR